MATVDSACMGLIEVPPSAYTLEGFTQWTYSKDFPEQGRITFVNGRIIIDISPERYETHNKIKAAINYAIIELVIKQDLGEFYTDGARFKNDDANVSNEPDAMFASWETLESSKLAPPPSEVVEEGMHIDLYGTPDWLCEIVSDSSAKKDTKTLRHAYHEAGVPEYCLIDARGEEIDFRILVWQKSGYVEAEDAEDQEGWRRSPVFDCQFQLTRSRNRVGNWRYDLSRR